MIYYALSLNAGSLGGGRYLSVALFGVVEMPVQFAAYLLINRLAGNVAIAALHICFKLYQYLL